MDNITKAVANGALSDLHRAWSSLPASWVLVGHCLNAALCSPDLRMFVMVHFWTTFLTGFGGGTLTAFMMMNHEKAPFSILYNHELAVAYTVCWWAVNYCPGRPLSKLLARQPFKAVIKMCTQLSRAKLIMARVNLAVEMYPGSLFGPLAIGTLCACGGKLLQDTIRMAQGVLVGPHEANVQTYSSRSAFLGAMFYLLASKWPPTAFMRPEEAFSALALLLVGHMALSECTGKPLDWTSPILNTLFTLTNVPIPQAPAANTRKPSPKSSSTITPFESASAAADKAHSSEQPRLASDAKPRPSAKPEGASPLRKRDMDAQAWEAGDAGHMCASDAAATTATAEGGNGAARRNRRARGTGGDGENGWTTVAYGTKKPAVSKKSR